MKGGICTNSQQNGEKSLFYAKNANKGQRILRHSAATPKNTKVSGAKCEGSVEV